MGRQLVLILIAKLSLDDIHLVLGRIIQILLQISSAIFKDQFDWEVDQVLTEDRARGLVRVRPILDAYLEVDVLAVVRADLVRVELVTCDGAPSIRRASRLRLAISSAVSLHALHF